MITPVNIAEDSCFWGFFVVVFFSAEEMAIFIDLYEQTFCA